MWVVLKRILKANGLIIQWGSVGSNVNSVSLSVAFTSTSYFVSVTGIREGNTSNAYDYVSNRTISTFSLVSVIDIPRIWFAIGY